MPFLSENLLFTRISAVYCNGDLGESQPKTDKVLAFSETLYRMSRIENSVRGAMGKTPKAESPDDPLNLIRLIPAKGDT